MKEEVIGMRLIVSAKTADTRQPHATPTTKTDDEALRPGKTPSCERHIRIAKRAYEVYATRGYRQGSALDDWLEAEREILSQTAPV